MALSDKENQDIKELNEHLRKEIQRLVLKYKAQIVASTMLANSLKLYKAILDPEDYDILIEEIVRMKTDVEAFDTRKLN
jgi:hypothetical protein